MAETESKESKKRTLMIVIIAIAALALVAVFALPRRPVNEKSAVPQQTQAQPGESTADATETAKTQAPTLEFPLALEGGKLEIENVFQYVGINPDCNNEDGTDVASIMLKNLSEDYLTEAKITLELLDGTAVNFVVNDLPAGKSVMAFSVDNTSTAVDAIWAAASCEANWDAELVPMPDGIGVAVDGVAITLTNNTDQDISELVVYCRCPLDEDYFGGVTYVYTVNDLPANGTATVEAWDCILGMVEVVRIVIN